MAITAAKELHVLSIKRVEFKSKEGEGVAYTEVIAIDGDDGEMVVLRAQDDTRFAGAKEGQAFKCEVSDDGPANLRVRKYRLHEYQAPKA